MSDLHTNFAFLQQKRKQQIYYDKLSGHRKNGTWYKQYLIGKIARYLIVNLTDVNQTNIFDIQTRSFKNYCWKITIHFV